MVKPQKINKIAWTQNSPFSEEFITLPLSPQRGWLIRLRVELSSSPFTSSPKRYWNNLIAFFKDSVSIPALDAIEKVRNGWFKKLSSTLRRPNSLIPLKLNRSYHLIQCQSTNIHIRTSNLVLTPLKLVFHWYD